MDDGPSEPAQLTYGVAPNRPRGFLARFDWMIATFTGVLVLFVGFVLFPSHTSHGPRKLTPCAANLRTIGQALYIYAQVGDVFPDASLDWKKILVDSGNIELARFICPNAGQAQSSYYYVPGFGLASDPRQIIAYENPANHGGKGGNALYQDAHVEFINAPKYQSLINSLKLPDGRPWTPHLNAKK